MKFEKSVEKLKRRLQCQREISGQRENLVKKTGENLWQDEHELPAGQLVSLIPRARSFALLSLIPTCMMIPAETEGCTGRWRTYRK